MGIVDLTDVVASSPTPQDFLSSPSLSTEPTLSPPQVSQHGFSLVTQDFLSSEHAFFSEQHELDSEQQLSAALSWECAFSTVPQPPQCALPVNVAAKRQIVVSRVFIIIFMV